MPRDPTTKRVERKIVALRQGRPRLPSEALSQSNCFSSKSNDPTYITLVPKVTGNAMRDKLPPQMRVVPAGGRATRSGSSLRLLAPTISCASLAKTLSHRPQRHHGAPLMTQVDSVRMFLKVAAFFVYVDFWFRNKRTLLVRLASAYHLAVQLERPCHLPKSPRAVSKM